MSDAADFEERDCVVYQETELVIPNDRKYRRFVLTLPDGTRVAIELDEDCVPVVYGVNHPTEDLEWGEPYTDEYGAGLITTFPRGTRDDMSR